MKITFRTQNRAFSLIEIIVCLAIIAIVCAITFPIATAAKQSAKKTTVKNALHQLYLSLALYRQDYDGTELQGSASELGLPNVDQFYFYRQEKHLTYPTYVVRFESGPIYYPMDKSSCFVATTAPFCLRKLDRWLDYNKRAQGDSVIIGDFQFTEPCTDYMSPTCVQSGIGVNLVGSLVSKKNTGSVSEGYWWNP